MQQRNLLISLIIILVLLAGAVFYFSPTGKKFFAFQRAMATLSAQEAILIIDFDGAKKEEQRWFKGQIVEGMTVKHVLQAASMAGNFSIQANSHLSAVDGVGDSGDSRWTCFHNNQPISGNLDDTVVNPKDRIVCEYR